MTGYQDEFEDALSTFSTPFNAQTSAEQSVQFAIEPQLGLTKRRYQWYSNGTFFDSTDISNVESGIRLETTATSNDSARIHSSIAGQYIAQTLARPGVGSVIDDSNVQIDSDNLCSLSHGEVYIGAFWWDETNDQVDTGIGYKFDETGMYFFVKSLGSHLGDSPVPQSKFSEDPYDGTGDSGQVFDPSIGYVYNFPFTWYNQGPLGGAILDPVSNKVQKMAELSISGRPSTNTPNFPVQIAVRNAGTAQSLGVELGGMQYATYGGSIADVEFRETEETHITEGDSFITASKSLTNGSVDPSAEPGIPLMSIQRESDSRDLALSIQEISVRPVNDDIYIFLWDEFDPSSALTGESFTDPVSANNSGTESDVLTDTQATDYTPGSNALLRSVKFYPGGEKNKTGKNVTKAIDARVEIGATRVITAVNNGDATADIDPLLVKIEESF